MGNFKIEIEAIGGHGYAREAKQGDPIPYRLVEMDPDNLAYAFVGQLRDKGSSIVAATLTHWPDTTPIIDNLKTGVREFGDFTEMWPGEPILQYFRFTHLPEKLQAVSRPFCHTAFALVRTLPRNAERTVALRKLLEAKDAAVRAALTES